MNDGTFEGYLAAWRDAHPQRATAWLFLRPDERMRFGGLACLQQEWLKAIHEIGEPQVAAVKLAWWREEMQRAPLGEARHPLTQVLFNDARVRAVPAPLWIAAVDAAMVRINAAPAADFAAQHAAVMPLAHAFAALETRVAFGSEAASDKAAAVWAVGMLIANLRALAAELGHGRSPVPMNLLARHGITREALLDDCPARRAALHDYAGELERALAEAAKMEAPLGLFRTVQLHGDLRSLHAAAHAEDPLHGLHEHRGGVGQLLKTWRAARISRRDALNWKPDATT